MESGKIANEIHQAKIDGKQGNDRPKTKREDKVKKDFLKRGVKWNKRWWEASELKKAL